MAFLVINSVKTSKADLPGIIADVQGLGLDTLRSQPGFRSARFVAAEDESDVKLIIEWESRDHFVAYRQSDEGRSVIGGAMRLHPQISFYGVVAAVDSAG